MGLEFLSAASSCVRPSFFFASWTDLSDLSAENNTAMKPRRVDTTYPFRMSDMAWASISTHRLQSHNFGRCMTATARAPMLNANVYANVMRLAPLGGRVQGDVDPNQTITTVAYINSFTHL